MGNRWVHLRICLTCGHVGCCDDSKNKPRPRTSRDGHPIIQSLSRAKTGAGATSTGSKCERSTAGSAAAV